MTKEDIRSRYIGHCWSDIEESNEPKVDLSTFVLRLLLFDTYILDSNSLKEFGSLIDAFGYGGVKEILLSGALRIHCESHVIGQTGQTGGGFRGRKRDGSPKILLPLNSYSFDVITHSDKQKEMREDMQHIYNIGGVQHKEAINLKRLIADNLVWFPKESFNTMLNQLLNDFRVKTPNIMNVVLTRLNRELTNGEGIKDFTFNIEVDEENDVHVSSDLSRNFGFNEHKVHEIFQGALLAIGGLNMRIETMRAFSALTGFRMNELNVFEEKVEFLIDIMSSETAEDKLQRILSWPQFPNLDKAIYDKKVNIETLLKIRDSAECREFRQWLWTNGSLAVDELQERLESLTNRLSLQMSGKTARVVRWLTTTGVGFIPGVGQVAGPLLGLLDTFLIDKLLRSSGVLTFIGTMYPSIFKGK
jgi:hypothetical protein